MAKRYTDELAEWVKEREALRPRQDKSLVAFLAIKGDVEEAINAGYALKTIWEHLHEKGRLSYRYETFLKHVKKHVKGKSASSVAPPREAISSAPVAPASLKTEPKAKSVAVKKPKAEGFQFNATSRKEDLL